MLNGVIKEQLAALARRSPQARDVLALIARDTAELSPASRAELVNEINRHLERMGLAPPRGLDNARGGGIVRARYV